MHGQWFIHNENVRNRFAKPSGTEFWFCYNKTLKFSLRSERSFTHRMINHIWCIYLVQVCWPWISFILLSSLHSMHVTQLSKRCTLRLYAYAYACVITVDIHSFCAVVYLLAWNFLSLCNDNCWRFWHFVTFDENSIKKRHLFNAFDHHSLIETWFSSNIRL